MQFMLNQTPITLQEYAPDTTLLEFLRTEVVQRGTKEGCASGDCGACTVVIAEPEGDQLRYRSINSCITYLGAVDGCQVITVEGLSSSSEALHPAQQVMVDHHASQCGFCTPGFVMSLFAMMHQPLKTPSQASIYEALGGNLCRCTGYRPIMDAAKALLLSELPDLFTDKEAEQLQRLKQWQKEKAPSTFTLTSTDSAFFASPKSIKSLIKLLDEHPDARIVAGSTDLALETTQQLSTLPKLIYTGHVAEMRVLEDHPDTLEIGAAVTYSEAETMLTKTFPALSHLLHRLGSLQVRNQGTLGGNIANASPIGDMPPVLLALDARLRIRNAQGVTEIPINEFFTGYRQTRLTTGSVIESIILPKLSDHSFFRIYKLSKRLDDDISAVCLALHLRLDGNRIIDARLGLGGMAAIPARAYQAESALIGKDFISDELHEAQMALSAEFSPLSDVRASAEYRMKSVQNLLLRATLERQSNQSLEVMHYAHLD